VVRMSSWWKTGSEWKYDYGLSVDKIVTSFITSPTRPVGELPSGIDERKFRPGKIHALYDAARNRHSKPLALLAAEKLLEKVAARSNVLILTGVLHPVHLPRGETDGPPGAAGLARALDVALEARSVLVSEPEITDVMSQTCIGAGLNPLALDVARQRPHSVVIRGFPRASVEQSQREAKKLIDEIDPSAVIAIERKGRNSKGQYHSILGTSRTETEAKLDYVADEARARGILTIGIGDNGNEIGFGNILDVVRDVQPFGAKCQCPCGAGVASTVETDVLLPASTSNWGAYGVEACMAILLEQPSIMHGYEIERRMLTNCANTGCADGATAETTPTVDGTGSATFALVELLHEIVELSVASKLRHF
jgi:hypothetical protein